MKTTAAAAATAQQSGAKHAATEPIADPKCRWTASAEVGAAQVRNCVTKHGLSLWIYVCRHHRVSLRDPVASRLSAALSAAAQQQRSSAAVHQSPSPLHQRSVSAGRLALFEWPVSERRQRPWYCLYMCRMFKNVVQTITYPAAVPVHQNHLKRK